MSEETVLRLMLQWPKGRSLFIKVNSSDTPMTLLKLCKNKSKNVSSRLLLHHGRILNPSLTFSFQNICDGDSIVVYEHESTFLTEPTSLDAKICSIMREAQVVHDRAFNNFEVNRKAGLIYDKMHQIDRALAEDGNVTEFETNIPEKRDTLCEEPLPMLLGNEEESSDEPYDGDSSGISIFETIEEAGKFFAKHPLNDWYW